VFGRDTPERAPGAAVSSVMTSPTPATNDQPSLYDKYGGFATVSQIVHSFYDHVMESALLSPYFAGVDMARVIGHQITFMCKVLGGPDNYKGASLVAIHARLGITSAAFDEVATILQETLEDAGVSDEDVALIIGVVASVKSEIVARAPAA
jgi:hemoglobin